MNDAAFEYLYKKYLNRLVRFINAQYRIDVEASKDIAQEVFKLLWEKREEIYDEDERMMLSWLYETAKLKSRNYKRKDSKVIIEYDPDLNAVSDDHWAEYEDLLHIEGFSSVDEKYQSYLSEIKKHLDEKESNLFTLVVEKKLDPTEAAAELNISNVNFRVKWHRLRYKLKPIIKKIIEK